VLGLDKSQDSYFLKKIKKKEPRLIELFSVYLSCRNLTECMQVFAYLIDDMGACNANQLVLEQ
jgi:hypothetical protein